MPPVNITCQACGYHERVSNRFAKQQKYCRVCQVLRDHRVKPIGHRECTECGELFWPIRTHKGWAVCGWCSTFNSLENPECAMCGDRRPLAAGLQNTCIGCVQHTEEARTQYLGVLERVRDKRTKEAMVAANV